MKNNEKQWRGNGALSALSSPSTLERVQFSIPVLQTLWEIYILNLKQGHRKSHEHRETKIVPVASIMNSWWHKERGSIDSACSLCFSLEKLVPVGAWLIINWARSSGMWQVPYDYATAYYSDAHQDISKRPIRPLRSGLLRWLWIE